MTNVCLRHLSKVELMYPNDGNWMNVGVRQAFTISCWRWSATEANQHDRLLPNSTSLEQNEALQRLKCLVKSSVVGYFRLEHVRFKPDFFEVLKRPLY